MALGRIELFDAEDLELREQARRDVEAGAEIAARLVLDEVDYPCCGFAGRCEILAALDALDLSSVRERPSRAAERLAALALARSEMEIGFAGIVSQERVDPSFFLGASGVGWAFLRVSGVSLPQVLSFR